MHSLPMSRSHLTWKASGVHRFSDSQCSYRCAKCGGENVLTLHYWFLPNMHAGLKLQVAVYFACRPATCSRRWCNLHLKLRTCCVTLSQNDRHYRKNRWKWSQTRQLFQTGDKIVKQKKLYKKNTRKHIYTIYLQLTQLEFPTSNGKSQTTATERVARAMQPHLLSNTGISIKITANITGRIQKTVSR